MSIKKRTITDEILDTPPGEEFDKSAELAFDAEEEVILAGIKAQYGGILTKVKVYKILPGKSQPAFCCESEENVNETEIQEQYGGGKYAVRFFIDGKLRHTAYFEVMEKLRKPGDSSPGDIQNQMLRESAQWNKELLLAILGRGNAPATQTPMAEVAQMWTLLQGMPQREDTTDKMLSMFTKGMEIAAMTNGSMDWKTALISTAKELAPSIMQLGGAIKGNPPVNDNGAGVPMLAGDPNHGQVLTPESMMKVGIDFIKPKVLAGLPVGLALDWIVANPQDYNQFLSVALNKNLEDFVKIDAELANEPYNSWVRQFLDGLREHFKAVAEGETEDLD